MRIFACLLALLLAVEPAFAACTLPTSAANEVGRGQNFDGSFANSLLSTQYDNILGNGARHYLWGHNDLTQTVPAGVHTGLYVPIYRTPHYFPPYTGRMLQWYRDNKPEWIVYRPDHKTPSWQFCDPNLTMTVVACDFDYGTPLATWLPEVQSYIEGADIHEAVLAGGFNAVSADNASSRNVWMKAGTCDIDPAAYGNARCEDTEVSPGVHGVWTPRYDEAYGVVQEIATEGATSITVAAGQGTAFHPGMRLQIRNSANETYYAGHNVSATGTSNTVRVFPLGAGVTVNVNDVIEAVTELDPDYSKDLSDWLAALRTHVNSVGLCLTANVGWANTTSDRSEWAKMIANLDIIYEESGFNNTGGTSIIPGGGVYQDATWINKTTDYFAANKPFVMAGGGSIDYLNRHERSAYGLASHLLIKNDHSYYAGWVVDPGRFEDVEPDMYWRHGAVSGAMANTGGVYYRNFTKGKALVNPSSTATVTYNLGSSVYNTDNGLRWTGTITMNPLRGLILRNGAPPGPIVLAR